MSSIKRTPLLSSVLLALLVTLALRIWTLEYPDLIDPTESRYAFIAQEMVLTGDWLTPKLPWDGGIEPYDGKPPFHFWLTALSISLFGMDEWVTRLPSFLGLVAIILGLWSLRRIEAFKDTGPLAALILASSALMFFMSGASVIDVTLAACTSLTIIVLAHLFFGTISKMRAGALMALALSCGFLTKGPIAMLIVGFALFIYVVIGRDYASLRKIPWVLSITLFFIIIAPWFILAEQAHPGFLKYFFINENFKRYLYKEYGDRYGSGHRYPIGTIWLFLSVSFLPWTLFFLPQSISPKSWWLSTKKYAARPERLFALAWALSPLIIFTFAKQIHAGYLVPSLPGLALVCASLFVDEEQAFRKKLLATLPWILMVISLGALVTGIIWGMSTLMILSTIPVCSVLVLLIYYSKRFSRTVFLALSACIAYSFSILVLSQGLSERKSAESILRCLTHFSNEKKVVVGILDSNSCSIYFYSRAWKGELERNAEVLFIKPDALPNPLPNDIILRTKDKDELLAGLPHEYNTIITLDRWAWIRRKELPIEVSACPADNG